MSMRASKRQEMRVSIFSHFTPKETSGQERKTFHPIPYRKMFAELDASGREAKAQYPEDSKTIDAFIQVLKLSCKSRYKKVLEGEWQPMKAEARFFLSEDRMSAYACVLPPENDGDAATLESFLADMHYEGVVYGILQEEIAREFQFGYLHIFPVARGKLPRAGVDGQLTELFRRRKNMCLEIRDGTQVDFGPDSQMQPIRKGSIICLIRPPAEGTDGMDVTGQRLSCPQAASVYVPQGENTRIDRGGRALVASVDGILYIENDHFCVHKYKIIDGDLEQFQGTLRVSENLYIAGNVDGGVSIEASGDIVINGKMGQAHVTSTCGTVRVQQGIYGAEGKTFLTTACQVQSPVVEGAEIEAGTSVIAETITNSVIRCGGTVYAMSGRGMIANSLVRAGDSVLCLRIGNIAGGSSQISVGYPAPVIESWIKVKAELPKIRPALDTLWKHITDLRKLGSRISDAEKQVLEQFVVQRELYMEKEEALRTELSTAEKIMSKKSKGRIRCEKLYPVLNVQIGRLREEITTEEENCNIHVDEGIIALK